MATEKIILLSDRRSDQERKEQELHYYNKELKRLVGRLRLVQHEIRVTEDIIRRIESEQITDLSKLQ